MSDIYIFKNGNKVRATIQKMFGTHGPYLLEGKRLDLLNKVQLLHDSSTATHHQTGTSVEKVNNKNMLKRAVVGELLLGPAGAIIGGNTAERTSTISSTTTTQVQTQITAELIYLDGGSQYIFMDDLKPFHWLLGFANQTPLSDEEIERERIAAINLKNAEQRRQAILTKLQQNLQMPELAEKKAKGYTIQKYVAVPILWFILVIFLGLVSPSFSALFTLLIIPYLIYSKKLTQILIEVINGISDKELKSQYHSTTNKLLNESLGYGVDDIKLLPTVFNPKNRYEMERNGAVIIVKPALNHWNTQGKKI